MLRSCSMSLMTSRYSSSILLALEAGEPRQPHLEDGVGLDLGELELAHQPAARRLDVLGRADQRDHLVEVVERDLEAFEDVGALLGLGQVELGAPPHHDLAVPHVLVDQRRAASAPAGGWSTSASMIAPNVVCSGVCTNSWLSTTFGFASFLSSITIRMPSRSDSSRRSLMPVELPLAHQVGDLLEQRGLVDLERDLGDDQAHAPGLALLDLHPRAHLDEPAAGQVAVADALRAVDDAAGREVGTLDDLEQVLVADVGIVDDVR